MKKINLYQFGEPCKVYYFFKGHLVIGRSQLSNLFFILINA